MRVGISVSSSLGPPADRAVAAMVERTAAARDAGLDHLSVGDRHAAGPRGEYVQGVPALARMLAEWDPQRPAGLLFLLPLWHPVMVAESVGTLAAMLRAPIIVQTGIGGGADAFAAMGADLTTRGRRTERAIAVVDALLQGETVTDDEFGIVDAAIGPVPHHGVEWWIGSGPGDVPIDRAARLGDAWYAPPGLRGEALADAVGRYRRRCAELDRPGRVALRRDIVLDTDGAAARRRAADLVAAGYRGLGVDQLLVGDAAAAAAELRRLAEVGVDDVVIRCADPHQPDALRSIEVAGQARTLATTT